MRCTIALIILGLLAIGCGRSNSDDVVTQAVPKQPPPSTMPAKIAPDGAMGSSMMPPLPGAAADPNAEKAIAFVTPDGWTKEAAKSMRVVSFSAGAASLDGAEMIVSKFPANSGSFLDNINRWRGQVGLPPAQSEAEAPATEIKVSGVGSKRYEFVGPQKKLVVAWAVKDGTWWFFKLLGPTQATDEQAGNFDRFIQSVKWQ